MKRYIARPLYLNCNKGVELLNENSSSAKSFRLDCVFDQKSCEKKL